MAIKMQIRNVRGAFLNLFEAQEEHGYNGKFIIAPDHPQIKEIEANMKKVAKEKWPDKHEKIWATFTWSGSKPDVGLVKDEYRNKEGDTYDGFEDSWHISAKSKTRPTIVDQRRNPLTSADGEVYSGCYGNLIVEIWAQDNKYGKGIRFDLKGFQKVRDGDAFGGGAPISVDEFDEVEDAGDSGFDNDLT